MTDWKAAWQPMIDAIGTDFAPGEPTLLPDAIDATAIRRLLEPLEFDCLLHYDADVARANGYETIVAPVTQLASLSIPVLWQPGETLFDSAARDAQPLRSPVARATTPMEPPTEAFFAADYEADYLRPAVVGDQLRRRGNRLIACTPKETSVGRGAFQTWEHTIYNQRDEEVARVRITIFRYNPKAAAT